jgi:hypothetical protein
LHASPNALPYEGAAFNHRDETAKLRSAASIGPAINFLANVMRRAG